jgi:hypothetical protein
MIPVDMWADGEMLCRLVRTTYEQLPPPKPRRPRAAKRVSDG